MGTAIGPALTYLLTNLPAVVAAVDPTASVTMGWPDLSADVVLVLGRTAPDDPTSETGTHAYVELGAQLVDEEFNLPFFIAAGVGGGSDPDPNVDAQLAAALAAIAIFDAFVAFLRTDLKLGGALSYGRIAQISSHRMRATDSLGAAKAGRQWVISSTVNAKNRY